MLTGVPRYGVAPRGCLTQQFPLPREYAGPAAEALPPDKTPFSRDPRFSNKETPLSRNLRLSNKETPLSRDLRLSNHC